jgi:hypothetical protein
MEPALHPAAPQHLAPFMTAPGHTDVLLVAMGILLVFAVVGVGVFYLKLHALPEQIAHRSQKVQFEIVAVLALLALFTHYHIFWIAALLLALIPIPDFSTPLISMADSLRLMSRPAKSIDALPPAEAAGQRATELPEA